MAWVYLLRLLLHNTLDLGHAHNLRQRDPLQMQPQQLIPDHNIVDNSSNLIPVHIGLLPLSLPLLGLSIEHPEQIPAGVLCDLAIEDQAFGLAEGHIG